MSDDPSWRTVLQSFDVSEFASGRLVQHLEACEQAALGFCRLLETWRSGTPAPASVAGRAEALEAAARRAAQEVLELDDILAEFLSELRPENTEGRSWYGEPGAGELVDWKPVLDRAGLDVPAAAAAHAYLELAVFVRALEGLATSARLGATPTRSQLWAGLFDLRDNLAPAVHDLQSLGP